MSLVKLDCVPRPRSLLKNVITGLALDELLGLEITGFKLVLNSH